MCEITDKIDRVRDNMIELRNNLSLYSAQLNTIETVWDSIPALIFYKDKLNNIVRVNEFFCKTINCTRQDVEGKNINQLMKDDKLAGKYAANDIDVLKYGIPKLGILEELFDTGIKLRTDKFPVSVNGKIEGVLGFSVIINNEK
jgi:PAS domain-containing protein